MLFTNSHADAEVISPSINTLRSERSLLSEGTRVMPLLLLTIVLIYSLSPSDSNRLKLISVRVLVCMSFGDPLLSSGDSKSSDNL